jgi:hypothetical protein
VTKPHKGAASSSTDAVVAISPRTPSELDVTQARAKPLWR